MKISLDDEEIAPEIYSLHLSELASLIYFLNDYIDKLKEGECTIKILPDKSYSPFSSDK